jgi:hypothetical protein
VASTGGGLTAILGEVESAMVAVAVAALLVAAPLLLLLKEQARPVIKMRMRKRKVTRWLCLVIVRPLLIRLEIEIQ